MAWDSCEKAIFHLQVLLLKTILYVGYAIIDQKKVDIYL